MPQFVALRPRTYSLPKLAIEPSSSADPSILWHSSRAIAGDNSRIGRLAHQTQGLLNARFGNEAQKRRLFKLNGQALLKGLIKHRITRLIVKIGKDNGVFVGQ